MSSSVTWGDYAASDVSDAAAKEELRENVYWQYFCGWECLQKDAKISEASIRRFRTILVDPSKVLKIKKNSEINTLAKNFYIKFESLIFLIQTFGIKR